MCQYVILSSCRTVMRNIIIKQHDSFKCIFNILYQRQCDLWARFYWETLGLGIHVNVIVTHIIYLNIVSDYVHPCLATILPNGFDLFQQDKMSCHCKICSVMVWGKCQSWSYWLGLQIPHISIWSATGGMWWINKSDP